jgi:hypothetical protein
MKKQRQCSTAVVLKAALIICICYIYMDRQGDMLLTKVNDAVKQRNAKSVALNTNDPQHASSDWKPAYVYRGGPSEPPKKLQWNGQVEQDKLVSWLTKNKTNGYFVDLAANDASDLSNTLSLEQHLNWTGLCVEANPEYWYRLGRLRSCTVVGAVVGKNANEVISFSMDTYMGGIVGNKFDNKRAPKRKTQERFTVQLDRTFQQFKVPLIIDYLSLDVEGAEESIMNAFPFQDYRFRFMTVERPSANLTAKLAEHGYQLVKKLVFFGDTLFAHKSELPGIDDIVDHYCKSPSNTKFKYCTDTATK